MKNKLLIYSSFLFSTFSFSQNVAINTTGALPNASAMLDVVSTNKGFLMPRVALTSTTDAVTVPAPANWLMVFNTANVSDVTEGMYYWNGAMWVKMLGSGDAWRTLGNAGTSAVNNFIGTTDAVDFVIRTNNTEKVRVQSGGNVGIGATPVASAKLDVNATDKGLMIPNVALTSRILAGPITLPATSLLVYNTATAGAAPNNVVPGYYYNAGTGAAPNWTRFATGNGDAWLTTGNAGTVAATNFIGTTDAIDWVMRTNNAERARITSAGRFGIGLTVPTSQLEVSSGATSDAVFGHSNQVGGYLGRETNITFGTPAQSLLGAGVYASNPSAGYTSMFSQSSGAATVAASINFSSVWIASYNYVENTSTTVNPTVVYGQLNNSGATLGGFQNAVFGYSDRGTTAGNPGYTIGGNFIADAQFQDSYGVGGISYSNALTAGGYFEGNNFAGVNQAYAYVGGRIAGVNRKITGTGTVAEIIPTENHGRVTLVCAESPEYWYQDYGTVEMINGKAHVDLDPILADIIIVDAENPIRTFFTPQDMLYFNGAAVVNQTPTGFDIVELNGGTNSGKIQYQIVVKPKTNYGEGRFSQAPGPSYLKSELEPKQAKAKNNPNDGREIFSWPSDHEVYKYNPEDFVEIGQMIPAGPNRGKIKLGEGKYSEGVGYPAKKTN